MAIGAGILFYAALDLREDDHERSLEDQARLKAENLAVIVLYPVLLEAHNLAARKLGHRKAGELVRRIEATAVLEAATLDKHEKARDRMEGCPDQELSLSDAVVVEMSEHLGLPAWAYDHHFEWIPRSGVNQPDLGAADTTHACCPDVRTWSWLLVEIGS